MKNSFLQEIIISVALIFILAFLIAPFGFMPPPFFMTANIFLAVFFVVFAVFVWREKSKDEREGFHAMLAGRMGFLSGAGVLAIAILIQGLRHMIDPWLPVALGAMVLAKALGLIYAKLKR